MTSTKNSDKSSGATRSTPDREYILWTVGVVFHIPSENDETKTLSWKRYVITIDNVEGEHTLWKGASMCNAYGAVETISASKDVVGKALEQWRQIGDDENVHTLAQKNGGRRNKRSSTDPSASSELAATNDHAIEKILSGPPYNKMLTFENVRIMRQLKVPVSKGSTFASAPFTTCPSSTSLPLNFTSGSNVRYIRLDPTWTLHDAFRGTEVIEHPTIHVLLSSGKVNNKLLASSFPMLIQEVPRKILS
uniref:BCD1 alpha/beta domain-containing protein n=1 Tax=Corethron hystrix TaxID=216773 RepID=A0A7S1BU87_9STRA|mmetsp:Transcript_41223/g.96667  ORF Transcript_41223/g.96667 Transcript_41223/m.96667 type:complete len:249 (+) Transcript_41223:2-748(+)